MKAIKTKYVSCTGNKPSRIRASAEGVKSIFYSVDQLSGITQSDRSDKWHGLAAELFRDENGWTYYAGNPANGVQDLASGQIGPDDHVHCFVDNQRLQGVVAQARVLVDAAPAPETGLPICDAYHFNLLKHSLNLLDGLA